MTTHRRADTRGKPNEPAFTPRHRDQKPRDPGAYIGRMPERATETIPGGVGPKDERVAAVATQPAPARGPAPASTEGGTPEGHREGENATDDRLREAGQNR
jgi:hypothetical protein